MTFDKAAAGYVLGRDQAAVRDMFGPVVELLTAGLDDASLPSLMRGMMPPGVVVPLHAHAEPETFYVLSGTVEALVMDAEDGHRWRKLDEGELFHVPPHARHALRNPGPDPHLALIVSAPDMIRFFEQAGIPLDSVDGPRRPPTVEDLQRMGELSARRGDWSADVEENRAVGIILGPDGPSFDRTGPDGPE